MATPLFPGIKIVPLDQCIAHEGVVDAWVGQIANNLLDAGVMKNPIIVSHLRKGGKRVVIDGMHRFAALRRLEIPHVMVYEIDYMDPEVRLAGWDALTFRSINAHKLINELFGDQKKFSIERTQSAVEAQNALRTRQALLAIGDRRGSFFLLCSKRAPSVDSLVKVSQKVDLSLDEKGFRPLYVADSLSIPDFDEKQASGIIFRAHYQKEEILERTLGGKLFPRKSTRHIIPRRPLRVDVGLPLLRTNISLDAKNEILNEHMRWCYESDRIRYYPESVFIFAD